MANAVQIPSRKRRFLRWLVYLIAAGVCLLVTLASAAAIYEANQRCATRQRCNCSHKALDERRATAGDVGSLFEGVGQLQDAPIVVMPAHNLQANGKPALRKSTRDGRGRISGG